MNSSVVLSAEHTASLLLIVLGVLLVLVLLAAFAWGSRRASRKKVSDPGENEPHPTGGSQHGKTWQTLEDDPEQGHPHRPGHDHPDGPDQGRPHR
ncbi:DUF6479 family protein [Streptomyces sp. NPDC048442]|uniref:DUF6479 family protein n=1 Tax=Streptomyces sp. NPDC048442 TaxID=3154823 RepID=UPI0034421BF7